MANRESPFQPGTRVIHVSDGLYGRRLGLVSKVLKVHKNGNFTLAGTEPQQYKPNRYPVEREDGKIWCAHKTGDRGFSTSRSHVELYVPEYHDKELTEARRSDEDSRAVGKLINALSGLSNRRPNITNEQRDLITKLTTTLEAPK